MTARIVLSVLIATLLAVVSTSAQSPGGQAPLAGRFVDPTNGLSLEQAIARAIEQEPSLRAARSQVEVAQAAKSQASLRPNPSVSFEWRDEPGGTDHLATIGVEWPLDLFRRGERVAVADREVTVAQLSASDRERLLAAEVRARYGDVLATIRDWGSSTKSWPRRRTSSTCFGLASKRERHHRSSATCWMSSFGGCRPTACCKRGGPRPRCSS